MVATGFGVVRAGAGAGVSAAGVAGTSLSCGCAALSRFAIWRSRFNAVSRASEVSLLLSETVQALNASAATITNGALRRRVYLDMRDLSGGGAASIAYNDEAAVVRRFND